MAAPPDPHRVRLSAHALRRCEEMQIPIADVVAMLGEPDVVRPAGGALMAFADRFRFAVVYVENDDNYTVITVVWRSVDPYQRQGRTFRTRSNDETITSDVRRQARRG